MSCLLNSLSSYFLRLDIQTMFMVRKWERFQFMIDYEVQQVRRVPTKTVWKIQLECFSLYSNEERHVICDGYWLTLAGLELGVWIQSQFLWPLFHQKEFKLFPSLNLMFFFDLFIQSKTILQRTLPDALKLSIAQKIENNLFSKVLSWLLPICNILHFLIDIISR